MPYPVRGISCLGGGGGGSRGYPVLVLPGAGCGKAGWGYPVLVLAGGGAGGTLVLVLAGGRVGVPSPSPSWGQGYPVLVLGDGDTLVQGGGQEQGVGVPCPGSGWGGQGGVQGGTLILVWAGVPLSPLWTNKQSENITFSRTSYAGGKYSSNFIHGIIL